MTRPTLDVCQAGPQVLGDDVPPESEADRRALDASADVGTDIRLVVEDARHRLEADAGQVRDIVHRRSTVVVRPAAAVPFIG